MFRFRADARACTARGFSLIELMTVVAIVAVLGTIAVSNYSNYVLRANRTEGRLALLAIQAAQEKYFLQNNAYAQNIATVILSPALGGLGVNLTPAGLTPTGIYTISLVATPNTYTVQADATGAQTRDTSCLTFTVTEQGIHTPADTTGCWK